MLTKGYYILKSSFHKGRNGAVKMSNNWSPALYRTKRPAPLHNKKEALIVIWFFTVMIISHVERNQSWSPFKEKYGIEKA